MKKPLLFSLLIVVLVSLPLSTACKGTEPSPTATPQPTISSTPTPEPHWWDKFGEPEYGGTITMRVDRLNPNFDTWYAGPFGGQIQQYETAFVDDWTLDRDIWSFNTGFTPPDYKVGCLAESWEMPDAQTLVLHIRQGVHWQNKEPVNGRELTAYDFEYQYDRMLGMGSGFTEPSPYWLRYTNYIEKLTATDKYTAVIKFKQPSALNLAYIQETGSGCLYIAPRESVEMSEDGFITDYRYVVGTGPWMVTDFVADVSVTFSRNPDYWGTDERHPENQLPYADTLNILNIPDIATALAALRTGKIDFLSNLDWQQAASLAETNPELQQAKQPSAGYSVDMRIDREPFTDIRVRKALQMAIDRELIAQTHYGGNVDGKPAGLVSPEFKGWCTPYDEWPQALKDEYSYNPVRAKELLAEAGYPNGFETNIVAAAYMDTDLLQIIKAQFMDIGVDMEIKVMEPTAFSPFTTAGKQDQMTYYPHTAPPFQPWVSLDYRSKIPVNFTFNKDPAYDAMIVELETTSDPAGPQRVSNEADQYALAQHWAVNVCPTVTFAIYQPYLKGYSGESMNSAHYARWWIDQDLKK